MVDCCEILLQFNIVMWKVGAERGPIFGISFQCWSKQQVLANPYIFGRIKIPLPFQDASLSFIWAEVIQINGFGFDNSMSIMFLLEWIAYMVCFEALIWIWNYKAREVIWNLSIKIDNPGKEYIPFPLCSPMRVSSPDSIVIVLCIYKFNP